MNIFPKNGYILVELVKKDTNTKSGFIVSKMSETDYFSGVVLVGDDEYGVGTHIVFPDYAPDEVEVGDEVRYFVKTKDIIATYED